MMDKAGGERENVSRDQERFDRDGGERQRKGERDGEQKSERKSQLKKRKLKLQTSIASYLDGRS